MGEDGLNANIQKGPVQRVVDQVLNDREGNVFSKRAEVRSALEDTSRYYCQILQEVFGMSESPFVAYLRRFWFPETANPASTPGVWWEDHQPIEPIIRQSLLQAIELAHPDLPIDSYWMAVGSTAYPSHASPCEVLLTRNDKQVTRLILTPPTPIPQDEAHLTVDADIWVVKRSKVGDWEKEVARDYASQVVTTQLKERPT